MRHPQGWGFFILKKSHNGKCKHAQWEEDISNLMEGLGE